MCIRDSASRINPDFAVTDEHRAWAKAKDLDYLDLDHITEKFVDYWLGKSGKDATKTDWTATWRNWIRREAESIPKPAGLRLASGWSAPTVDDFGYHDE